MTEETIRDEGEPRLLQQSMMAWVANALLLCAVGMALGPRYHPSVDQAYASSAQMHEAGWVRFAQGFHYWGSAILIVHAVAQLIAMFLRGVYGRENRWGVIAGLCMLCTSLGFQITGNLLRFDRQGVQTAAIENGIMTRAPIVGKQLADFAFSGTGVTGATLPNWYALHRLLPFAVLLIGWLCWLWARGGGKYYAHWTTYLPPIFAALLSFVIASPLGSPATRADFASFDAQVSWYTLPLHGSMSMVDSIVRGGGWIGSFAIPGLILVALLASGWVSSKASWPKWVVVGSISYFFIAIVGWGGSFAPLTGKRDPVSLDGPVAVKPRSPVIDKALAEQGHAFFNEYCAPCHGKDGRDGGGGPSLAKINEKHPDADFFMRYVKDPKSVNPNSTMPGFADMKRTELAAVAEYLRSPH